MFEATDDISRTELASRERDGVVVRLFWTRSTSLVTVAVDDAANDDYFELILGEDDQALDVFHHPFAYAAARGVEFRSGSERVGEMDDTTSVSNVIALPLRDESDERGSLEHDVVFALATADDLASGMKNVLERIRRDALAARVEWWTTGDDGALDLFVAVGAARGRRETLQLGRANVLVLHDGRIDQEIESAMGTLTPILRRRAAEERLARTTIQLAQHNEALEDFAALVAHELKTPLQAALVTDEPSRSIEDALLLVDALLEASQSPSGDRRFASVADCLDQAVEDLHAEVEITTDVTTTLPLPPAPLRTILRNLLSNAVAAGAGRVHVTAARSSGSWRVVVDDEGVGLAAIDRYVGGSGLGLSLSRRIAARFGGVLELEARPTGGTRATLEFAEAA